MQYLFWLIPIAIAVIAGAAVMLIRHSKFKLLQKIDSEFGKSPDHDDDFDIETVNGYHYYALNENEQEEYIDSITWNDLSMDDVYKRVDSCQTTIGQEYLYHKLHKVCLDEESAQDNGVLSEMFNNDKRRRETLGYLAKLGKTNYSIASLVFDPKQYKLKLPAFVYTALTVSAILLIISTIVCLALSLSIGSVLLILGFINMIVNVVLYYMTKLRLENQLNMLRVFAGALWTCRKIIKLNADEAYFERLKEECKKLKYLRSRISGKAMSAVSEADYFKEFIFMLFLVDIRRYNKSIKKIIENKEAVKYVYKSVGEIDTAINTLSFMKSLSISCKPDFCIENNIEFEEVYHPLLSDPVTNSGRFSRSIIITGANASGKSTFIKAIAVNSILALTLGVCCAKSYKLRRALPISSMAQRDDIIKGDSYYIAELKSLKRILDKIEKLPCTCFVDEILKGTNTTERISASISVLEYMSGKDCISMIATHDTQIAETLEGMYDNYHFEERISDNDIEFDYILKQGIAKGKNAVKLLSFFDFPEEIVNEANKRVREAEES